MIFRTRFTAEAKEQYDDLPQLKLKKVKRARHGTRRRGYDTTACTFGHGTVPERTFGVNIWLLTGYYPFASVRPPGFVWPGVDGPVCGSAWEGTWRRNGWL